MITSINEGFFLALRFLLMNRYVHLLIEIKNVKYLFIQMEMEMETSI